MLSQPVLRAFYRARPTSVCKTALWDVAHNTGLIGWSATVSRVETRPASSSSSTRWKSRQGKDSFAREARVQGLKSRAAFKLLEVRCLLRAPIGVGRKERC
jgi:hypothetical protein